MMEIISAQKDRTGWWVHSDDGMMRRVRHSIDTATDNPISTDEEFMCTLLDKLYPSGVTSGTIE
jgi:hypothetical protein